MISKDERKSIGISAVASIIGMCSVVLPIGWYLVKPALADSLATQMMEKTQVQIKNAVAPLNAGFKAILQQNIENLERDIAKLEFKRDAGDPNDWTAEDAAELAQYRIDLANQREALAAIRSAEQN